MLSDHLIISVWTSPWVKMMAAGGKFSGIAGGHSKKSYEDSYL